MKDRVFKVELDAEAVARVERLARESGQPVREVLREVVRSRLDAGPVFEDMAIPVLNE